MTRSHAKHDKNYRTNPYTHNYQGLYGNNPFLKEELKRFYRESEMFAKYGNRFKIPKENKREVANFLIENFKSELYSDQEIKIGVSKLLRL